MRGSAGRDDERLDQIRREYREHLAACREARGCPASLHLSTCAEFRELIREEDWMANARTCDGPDCDHVGSANPEGWLTVNVDVLLTDRATLPEGLLGQHDFAELGCLEAWLDQFLPKPEKPKPSRSKRRS